MKKKSYMWHLESGVTFVLLDTVCGFEVTLEVHRNTNLIHHLMWIRRKPCKKWKLTW